MISVLYRTHLCLKWSLGISNFLEEISSLSQHPKTHIKQINEDKTQKANIKSSKGEITNNLQGGSHKENS